MISCSRSAKDLDSTRGTSKVLMVIYEPFYRPEAYILDLDPHM